MAMHPFAVCVSEPNSQQPNPTAVCLPHLMKEDLPAHHHHHHLQELERLSKIPINGKSAWTDAATDVLIDVFEEKWNALRRGNLKAKNWDEVGAELGNRCGVPKTGDQCRHKIEKLRGKFRQEKVVAVLGQSKWPWYDRLNAMFGGGGNTATATATADKPEKNGREAFQTGAGAGGGSGHSHTLSHAHAHIEETATPAPGCGIVANSNHHHHALELAESRGGDRDDRTEKGGDTTSYTSDSRRSSDVKSGGRKRARESDDHLGAAIKYLSETLLKIEECKLELQRDNERVRAEMETRREQMHEVELKRTEMLIQMELKRTEMLCELELRRTKMQMDLFESLASRASSRPKRSN